MSAAAAATTDENPPEQQSEEIPPPPQSAENPPVPQPSETLTLNATSDPQDNDSNQEDPMGAAPATPSSVRRGGGGGGLKRNKSKRLPAARLKKFQKKLEALNENLHPIPFKPAKDLDFDSHEELLRRLGLWDFVKLHFDATLRTDLVAQLIASYDPQQRGGYVNEARVRVNRADLARALKLPTKKEKVPSSETSSAVAGEVKESEEAIAFVDELVSTWMLLHDDDTWMMPAEIHNMTRTIKDGSFERVDWAGLIWYMVEKELSAAPNLGKCYYASHLQCLIKCQKENMLKGEEASYRKELDFKEEEEDEEVVETVVVKTSEEELRVVAKSGEYSIELSLGATSTDNAAAAAAVDVRAGDEDGGAEAENGSKEEDRPQEEPAAMAVEESKEVAVEEEEEEEQGQWFKSNVNESFLQLCSSIVKPDDDDDMGCEAERKQEIVAGVDDDDATKERERDEEEVVEEEAVEEMDFDQAPKEHDALDGLASENLLGSMELAQDHLASDMQQLHADLTSGEFLAASRIDVDANPGSSSLYGTGNDLKRDIGQLHHDDDDDEDDDGIPRHAFDKRMRSDEVPWEGKSSSSECIGQLQHWLEKLRVAQMEKDQMCQDQSLNQQMLLNEMQARDNMIQRLNRLLYEEQTKRQVEVYKLERELFTMGSLLEGYRKALKETHRAFSDYRAKHPTREEPLYKDAGPGGLVLTATELEKQRQREEEEKEEERLARLCIEKKVIEFEEEWVGKLREYTARVELLGERLQGGEKNVEALMEVHSKKHRSPHQVSESTPAE